MTSKKGRFRSFFEKLKNTFLVAYNAMKMRCSYKLYLWSIIGDHKCIFTFFENRPKSTLFT